MNAIILELILSTLSVESLHRFLDFIGVKTSPELNHSELVARAIANWPKFWDRIHQQMVHQFDAHGTKSLSDIDTSVNVLIENIVQILSMPQSLRLTNDQLEFTLNVGLKLVHGALSDSDLFEVLLHEDPRVTDQFRFHLINQTCDALDLIFDV